MKLEKWTQPYWERRTRPPLNSLPYWNYWLKKTRIFRNNLQIREWWCEVMLIRTPPFQKNEEKYKEELLDRIEEGWQGEEWAINMPQIANEILRQSLLTTRTPQATTANHEAIGIQWICMKELGKARTNRCRAVRKLKEKRRKTQRVP